MISAQNQLTVALPSKKYPVGSREKRGLEFARNGKLEGRFLAALRELDADGHVHRIPILGSPTKPESPVTTLPVVICQNHGICRRSVVAPDRSRVAESEHVDAIVVCLCLHSPAQLPSEKQ